LIISTVMAQVAMISSLALAAADSVPNPIATRAKSAVPSVPPPPAPPPPAVRQKGKARHAVPLNNPGYWATTDDYPISALRNAESGTTGFRLTIAKDGRVSQCQITSSSGSAALDEATCRLVTLRAKFTPALNAKGKPVEDAYSNRIHWVIPKDTALPDFEPFTRDIEVDLDPQGRVEACRILASKGGSAMPDACADILNAPTPFPLSVAQKAENKRRTVRMRMQIDIRERN
jgi:TonB family protein